MKGCHAFFDFMRLEADKFVLAANHLRAMGVPAKPHQFCKEQDKISQTEARK